MWNFMWKKKCFIIAIYRVNLLQEHEWIMSKLPRGKWLVVFLCICLIVLQQKDGHPAANSESFPLCALLYECSLSPCRINRLKTKSCYHQITSQKMVFALWSWKCWFILFIFFMAFKVLQTNIIKYRLKIMLYFGMERITDEKPPACMWDNKCG